MFSPNLQIVITSTEDANAIIEMTQRASVFNAEEVATVQELLDEYFWRGPAASGYYFLSCKNAGRVVGFACYGPRALTEGTYDLFWIVTDKTACRSGIGGALSERVAREVAAMGGRLLVAETSNRPEYEPARRFYETHQYQCATVISDFYAPGDDLVIYVQRVNETHLQMAEWQPESG